MIKRSPEEIKRIENEIEDEMYMNDHYRVDTELLDSLDDLALSHEVIELNDCVLEQYDNYLHRLEELPENVCVAYQRFLMDADIIDNQSVEMQDSFLAAIYAKMEKKHAIEYLIDDPGISKETLIEAHDSIMLNATAAYSDTGFRDENTKVVGSMINGKRMIKYIPVDKDRIEFISDSIIKYSNDDTNENQYRIFIKPIILHGLVAAYQMFNDGNTRLARTLQHSKIYKMTERYTNYVLDYPVVYASRQYYAYRENYRKLITDLVVKHDDKAWNNWIIFNLRTIDDAIYSNISRVEDMYNDQQEKMYNLYKKRMNK